jgi:transitional endoplasmic reticulum ATPase
MGFYGDRKVEHETECEAAIRAGDSGKAAFHAAKAAEFCYALAQETSGPVSASYVSMAEGWLEIAEKLKTAKLPKSVASSDGRANSPGEQRLGGATSPLPAGGASSPSEPPSPGEPSDSEFLISADTGVSFDDIDGMAEAKAAIRDMVVNPMLQPEKAKALNIKPGGGVLLYGPPGNGKTMFGKAIAHEIKAPFFFASGAQLRSKWHGESEQKLSRLIHEAQSRPVAVLFLDEIDGLLPRRTENSSAVDNRLVTQFLADVGGFKDSPNTLLILGATNKPWEIDDAVFRTGRFDEKIYIGVPDAEARLGMLRRAFKGVALEEGLSLEDWAEKLEMYSGSDVVGLARKACQIAFRRSIDDNTEPLVMTDDFEKARGTIPSSITPAMLKQFEEFNRKRFS